MRKLWVPGTSKEVDLMSKLSRKTPELLHEALWDWRRVKNKDFLNHGIQITTVESESLSRCLGVAFAALYGIESFGFIIGTYHASLLPKRNGIILSDSIFPERKHLL